MSNSKIEYFINTLFENNERISDITRKLQEGSLTKCEQSMLHAHLVLQESLTNLLKKELEKSKVDET